MEFFYEICKLPNLLLRDEVMKLSTEIWGWISSKPEYSMAVFTLCASLWEMSTHQDKGLFRPDR